MTDDDVASPIDLRCPDEARAWAEQAPQRPGRQQIVRAFGEQLAALPTSRPAVPELGSGPGFLAEFLLEALPALELTLLDFSAAMHALAQARLQRFAAEVTFLERDFSSADWFAGLRKSS